MISLPLNSPLSSVALKVHLILKYSNRTVTWYFCSPTTVQKTLCTKFHAILSRMFADTHIIVENR